VKKTCWSIGQTQIWWTQHLLQCSRWAGYDNLQ
jgi:hypothetical protein